MTLGRIGRWFGYAALVLVAYVVFLLIFAPASYLARGIEFASRGTVSLQQPTGTLWQGSGVIQSARGPLPFERVQWTLRPWSVFGGTIGADLELTGTDAQAKAAVELGLKHHTLRDVVVTVPISAVTRFYPLAELLGLSGRVQLTATTIEITKDAIRGGADMSWENAASRLLPVSPAGDYKVRIDLQGQHADVNVSTMRGTLQVVAKGEWRLLEGGTLKLRGTVSTATPQPALEPFLNSIGRAQSDGRHPFAYENRIGYFLPATLFPF